MEEHFISKFCRWITLPLGQVTMIIVTVIAISLFTYQYRSGFPVLENNSPLFPVTPQDINEWGNKPTEILTGLKIVNFSEFDVLTNNFIFDGPIWFQFDPALISLDTIAKFSFERGNIRSKSEPYVKIINGKFFARYNVRVDFTTNLNYKMLPFDNHRIHIILVNKFISPSEAVYSSGEADFSMAAGTTILGWKPVRFSVATGYEKFILDKFDPTKTFFHPKVVFSIDIQRLGIEEILLIMLPLFLIFFIGLFSFAFNPSENPSTILGLTSASVASLISFKFVIQRMSPVVGYFTFSDIIFMLLLSCSFLAFLFNLFIIKFAKPSELVVIVRGTIFISFHLIIITTWYYLLNFWDVAQ